MKTILIITLFIGISSQCEDSMGQNRCLQILQTRKNRCDNLDVSDQYQCQKTCEICKLEKVNSAKPPSWASAPANVIYPLGDKKGNDNNKPSKDEDSLALPLYAVIIIIVAVLVIFIGITVCFMKLRRKWRRRKQKRKRKLMQNQPSQMNTMSIRPNYMWSTESFNGAYAPDIIAEGWGREHWYPNGDMSDSPQHFETSVKKSETAEKRKAPDPPAEYQNLHQIQRTNKQKASAPQPPTMLNATSDDGRANKIADIPNGYADPNYTEDISPENAQATSNQGNIQTPSLPPISPLKVNELNQSKEGNPIYLVESEDVSYGADTDENSEKENESEISTVRVTKRISCMSQDTEQTVPALSNILNEWKEHLIEQKKELEEYYKSLAKYVKVLGLKPRVEQSGHDETMQAWLRSNESAEEMNEKSRRQNHISNPKLAHAQEWFKFPKPPESVRGDFCWDPNDVRSQKQVIGELKKKLENLQNLVESVHDAPENQKKTTVFIPSQHSNGGNKYNSNSLERERLTIKSLIQRLQSREKNRIQMRIAQALDKSRKRGIMAIVPQDGPIACLSKQIHHVMVDILDPRTSTKIDLGAHAACTLAHKLLKNVHANLLTILREHEPRQRVENTSERISFYTKQLLDMIQQLISRQSSFLVKDYNVFTNAFVDTTGKIMDTTHHFVCIIFDLQRTERKEMIAKSSKTYSQPRLSLQPLLVEQRRQESEISSRLHSESHSTSLSVADVCRLTADLAHLRELLNRDSLVPSFSEAQNSVTTLTMEHPKHEYMEQIDNALEDSEYDTMSTFSCSTCVHGKQNANMYSDHLQLLKKPNCVEHFPRNKRNQTQYADIVFPSDRPVTRVPNLGVQESSNVPLAPPPFDINSVQSSHATKEHQKKTSTLDPSSFASFRSDSENKEVLQPRHRAMLARYFGGETIEPKNIPKQPEKNLPVSPKLQDQDGQLSPVLCPFNVNCNDVDVPTVTMLPCGLVANDTPPITNPPAEKRIKFPKIPKITVLRNGAGDMVTASGEHVRMSSDADEPNNKTGSEYADIPCGLSEDYAFSNTLLIRDVKSAVKPSSNSDGMESSVDSFSANSNVYSTPYSGDLAGLFLKSHESEQCSTTDDEFEVVKDGMYKTESIPNKTASKHSDDEEVTDYDALNIADVLENMTDIDEFSPEQITESDGIDSSTKLSVSDAESIVWPSLKSNLSDSQSTQISPKD